MNLSRRGFLRALGITSAVIALPTLWLPASDEIALVKSRACIPSMAECASIQEALLRSLTDPTNPRQPEAARVLTEWMAQA